MKEFEEPGRETSGAEGSLPAAPAPAPAPTPLAGALPRPRSSFFELALVVLLALFMALLLKVYVAEAYEIRGKSMQPTFEEAERVMVLKVLYEIRRGDIIIFTSSENGQKDLIKRVIGLPGDHLEVVDGEVYLNGEKLVEPYTMNKHSQNGYHRREFQALDVTEGKYYVLGDNRPDSHDSRKFLAIDAASIKGKVVLRWWPLEKLKASSF